MPRRKIGTETKIWAIEQVSQGRSADETAAEIGVHPSLVRWWASVYEFHGIEGLERKHQTYSGEYKKQVIDDVRENGLSYRQAAAKYNIWHPSFRRAEPHGSSQKNFIFLTEDDPPLTGGLTAYRFLADSHMVSHAELSYQNKRQKARRSPRRDAGTSFFQKAKVRYSFDTVMSRILMSSWEFQRSHYFAIISTNHLSPYR